MITVFGAVLAAMQFAGDWDINSSVAGEVTEIIVQNKVRHLPVVFVGDRDRAAAEKRAKPFMKVGHPIYILASTNASDIVQLALNLRRKYDLKPKIEVTGAACWGAAEAYRASMKDPDGGFMTWVHAEDTPEGFISEDLIVAPTTARASKAFARRIVTPVSVVTNAAGKVLVDFGKDAFGWAEGRLRGEVEGLAGEKLDRAGSIDVLPFSAIRSAGVRSGGAAADGWRRLAFRTEIFSRGRCLSIPRELGEVMPFRYLEFAAETFDRVESLRMIALEYPLDESESGLVSSCPALDRIYEFCRYTIRATTFGGLYIDGDRERLPYEADAYVTQLSNYAVSSDYELSRVTHDYLMPYPTWPTEYRQISVLMAWSYWMWSGDRSLLVKYYDQLRNEKMMEKFRRESDGLLETGGAMFHGAYEGAADIADWPPPERFDFEFRKANAVVNAYYYMTLGAMADIAGELGKTEDRAEYLAKRERVRESFQRAFFDAERGLYLDGQGATHVSVHANSIAVVAGLVPAERLGGVGNWLASREMECSVYFAQHFLEALFKTGHGARALELMTADNDRSWIGMLKGGATMTKESWNEDVKANIDWNHSWGTAALNVIARCLAGVTPAAPGFTKVNISPDPAGLERFTVKVPTARGTVTVDYDRSRGNDAFRILKKFH